MCGRKYGLVGENVCGWQKIMLAVSKKVHGMKQINKNHQHPEDQIKNSLSTYLSVLCQVSYYYYFQPVYHTVKQPPQHSSIFLPDILSDSMIPLRYLSKIGGHRNSRRSVSKRRLQVTDSPKAQNLRHSVAVRLSPAAVQSSQRVRRTSDSINV